MWHYRRVGAQEDSHESQKDMEASSVQRGEEIGEAVPLSVDPNQRVRKVDRNLAKS